MTETLGEGSYKYQTVVLKKRSNYSEVKKNKKIKISVVGHGKTWLVEETANESDTVPAMTTTTGIKRKGMKVSEEIVDKTMSA